MKKSVRWLSFPYHQAYSLERSGFCTVEECYTNVEKIATMSVKTIDNIFVKTSTAFTACESKIEPFYLYRRAQFCTCMLLMVEKEFR